MSRPHPGDLDVLYGDNHLLAVNKPAGLVTQPAPGGADSLQDRAKIWVRQAHGKPGDVFLEPVHRIDRPVSGVVLFARTSKALARCQQAVRERHWSKSYLAVVHGSPPEPAGRLRDFLVHQSRRAAIAAPETPNAREAVLEYQLLRQHAGHALLRIQLLTGRYHQIRAQLAHAGCPIVGDTKYGGEGALPDGAIALHHHRLDIEHPVRKIPCTFAAPPPAARPWTDFPDLGD
jgi:23S rRNA pseudouridine1911/1915/1917 synthase